MRVLRLLGAGVLAAAGTMIAARGIVLTARDDYDVERAGWILFGALGIAMGLVLIAGAYLLLRPDARGRGWVAIAVAAVLVAIISLLFGPAVLVVWPLLAVTAYLAVRRAGTSRAT